jgi:hypothetical protein
MGQIIRTRFVSIKSRFNKCNTSPNIRENVNDSWTLQEEDKDMIVMYHSGWIETAKRTNRCKMVCLGDDQTYTAMAKTVRFTVAMAIINPEW